jgi:hypothetical protein
VELGMKQKKVRMGIKNTELRKENKVLQWYGKYGKQP